MSYMGTHHAFACGRSPPSGRAIHARARAERSTPLTLTPMHATAARPCPFLPPTVSWHARSHTPPNGRVSAAADKNTGGCARAGRLLVSIALVQHSAARANATRHGCINRHPHAGCCPMRAVCCMLRSCWVACCKLCSMSHPVLHCCCAHGEQRGQGGISAADEIADTAGRRGHSPHS